VQLHQAPARRMERRAEISSSEGLKQGSVPPRPGHPSALPQAGAGTQHARGKTGTTLRRKLPAHGCFVEVTELMAVLKRSARSDYLTDKDTALAADAKGGSIWEYPQPSPVLTDTRADLK